MVVIAWITMWLLDLDVEMREDTPSSENGSVKQQMLFILDFAVFRGNFQCFIELCMPDELVFRFGRRIRVLNMLVTVLGVRH